MHILIVSKSNLKLQVFGLFSRFVRTLIIKISSSEEPANSTSIHRVRNGGKLVILFHPFPKSITERCRSLSWKPAKARWKYQNGAERAEQIFLAHAQQNAPLLELTTIFSAYNTTLSEVTLLCWTNLTQSERVKQDILNRMISKGVFAV